MNPSQVFFTDFRTHDDTNVLKKLDHLMTAAGLDTIDFEKQFTAIKMHFGEPGNVAYLRPNYARVVVEHVRKLGGLPFLTDCNTLYVGRRKHALDHLDAAYENGFSPFSAGCQIIIADGLRGTDERLVPVDGEYIKEAKIGSAVMDADVFISLSHFKGHELTGFGGALKNIGMGCGSRAGKMDQHSDGKPVVNEERCRRCGKCMAQCAQMAISFAGRDGKAWVDHEKCVGCGRCVGTCNFDAIRAESDKTGELLNRKMAEYSLAVCQGRPHFHISLVMDVSPACDCVASHDVPLVPDVGMFASFDPVALDQACVDAVNRMPVIAESALAELEQTHEDHFSNMHPTTNWRECLAHAEKIGLGTRTYELVTI